MPLALKVITISECLCCLPDKVPVFLNLTRFCPKVARILRNNTRKNISSRNFWGYVPLSPTPMLTGNINDITLHKKDHKTSKS